MKRICANERREAVRTRILREFPKSIREMIEHGSQEESSLAQGEDAFNNIKVFCVSSTDYMSIENYSDGYPAV